MLGLSLEKMEHKQLKSRGTEKGMKTKEEDLSILQKQKHHGCILQVIIIFNIAKHITQLLDSYEY